MIYQLINDMYKHSFIASLTVCLVFCFYYFKVVRFPRKTICLVFCFFISFFLFYLPIFGIEKYFEWKLDTFDLNGDGIFSDSESTDEQYFYQRVYLDELGRTTDRISYFISSVVVSLFALAVCLLLKKGLAWIKKTVLRS
ncbi:hypothetical protein [Marinomonas aquiplantarum]|uniref:Uncharacterized protein n=1 Tax=Marinomonas aquiplantarum TaxID=491951 RepID=A0A366D7A5_9GAMM|nr:hypothetical protein [Marinomonas aquiplantarum]RBO85920.1 hypothetical protein DFP76_101195 [Marinomonas aquiplantarum]